MSDRTEAIPTLRRSTSFDSFAVEHALVRGWYVAARSRRLKVGAVRRVELARRRLVVWRDRHGTPRAADARCPHLGADLAQGRVEGQTLRCAFHGWCFDGVGRCVEAPGQEALPQRSVRTYSMCERFGLVWVFAGDEPAFDPPVLPAGDATGDCRRVLLPPQHLRCHTHLVIGNGLDPHHFDALHGMTHTAEPELQQPEAHVLSLRLRGRPRSAAMRWLTGTRSSDIDATFQTIGPSIAWATIRAPVRFHMLFTGRPTADGGCATQVALFLPRRLGPRAVRAVILMLMLLRDDRAVLESLDFHASFTEADEPMRRFAAIIDELGTP